MALLGREKDFVCIDCSTTFVSMYWFDGTSNEKPCKSCNSTNTKLKEYNHNTCDIYVIGAGDWNKEEFNHGLGEVTHGIRDAERKARAKGLIPVGSEKLDRFESYQDKTLERNIDARWERAMPEAAYHMQQALRRR